MKNRKFPFGYKMENGEVVKSAEESRIVEWVYEEYIGGENLLRIAEKLKTMKIEYLPGETGWNKNRIKRILEDERYLGYGKFPCIVTAEIQKKANEIKLHKRKPAVSNVNAQTKPFVYSFRCAECGAPLRHITNNSLKSSEIWVCKSENCGLRVKIPIDVLMDEVLKILNGIIKNPGIIQYTETDEEPDTSKYDNEIEMRIASYSDNKEEIQNLILDYAAKKFEEDKSIKYLSDRLKADFGNAEPLSAFSMEFFSKTVKTVFLTDDGEIMTELKNGQIIKDDDINGRKEESENYTCES